MLKNLSSRKFFEHFRSGFIPFFVLFSTHAVSGTSYLDPARIVFERPSLTTQQDLIKCFISGVCEHDDKIRIYPMPCEGSNGADCTGCYVLRGSAPVRVDDLNSAGNCAGIGSASEQKIRVFVGYERYCPGATTAGTVCADGQLLLSCNVSTEGPASGNALPYDRDCFSGRPYVRRAKAASTIIAITGAPVVAAADLPVCAAGTTGIYPSCTPCSDTSYKTTGGADSCTECVLPTILNSLSPTISTAGTTKTSPNDCRVQYTCKSPYTPNLATGTCDSTPSATCNLSIIGTTDPTAPNYNNGVFSAAASSANRRFTFSINPNVGTRAPITVIGSTEILKVSDLAGGSYTVTAIDQANPACSLSRVVSLNGGTGSTTTPSPTPSPSIIPAPSPSPSPSPAPSPIIGPCGLEFYNTNTAWLDANTGAMYGWIYGSVGGLSISLSPTVGNPPVLSSNYFYIDKLPVGTYTLTASDAGIIDCSKSKDFIITGAPPNPSPVPNLCPRVVYDVYPNAPYGALHSIDFWLDNNLLPGDTFKFMAYSHWSQEIVATTTDTPFTMVAKIAAAINNTTEAQWNDGYYGRAPIGTPGFKPVATSLGNNLNIVLGAQDDVFLKVRRVGCVDYL